VRKLQQGMSDLRVQHRGDVAASASMVQASDVLQQQHACDFVT
jgi:hypothetical protein